MGVRLVQLHRPAQSDARLELQQRRRQRLRDVDARRVARPHLPRRLPQRAAGRRSCRCRRRTRPGWSRRCRPTTCCGGCTRSACSSSAARRTSCRSCIALVRNKSVDEIGLNGAALHALWTLHGLGELAEPERRGGQGGGRRAEASRPPACARRRRWCCRRRPKAASAIAGGGPARGQGSAHPAGGDPGDRRRAGVAGARPAALQGEHRHRQLQRSLVEPRDVHRRDSRHKAAFLAEYKADANAVPTGSLPIALRIGATKPDWRTPDKASRCRRTGRTCRCPATGSRAASRTSTAWCGSRGPIEAPQGAGEATLSLGRISNTAEVWVNGLSVTQNATRRRLRRRAAPGGGRGGGGRGAAPAAAAPPAGGRGICPTSCRRAR